MGSMPDRFTVRPTGSRRRRGNIGAMPSRILLRTACIVLPLLAGCDLVFMNGENFIRPGTMKGRRLLMLAYLAKVVFGKPVVLANLSLDLSEPALAELVAQVLPLLDDCLLYTSPSPRD